MSKKENLTNLPLSSFYNDTEQSTRARDFFDLSEDLCKQVEREGNFRDFIKGRKKREFWK